ncbi:septum site-determining protein MinC [Bradyrhizobium sp. SZCCHNR1015]|uniref:septum site-determining protein MinC n=1 Tax=Bradyrhizobium sp. SZCCHNR1015 TaxID=3057338 RepID=UPI0029169852|nr:septum site-determining protein MinC [Bradyrhizobium sp. SZCCHNR1015]
MVMSASAETVRPVIRLRGRSYVAFVFSPVVPIADWLAELDATLKGSPGFFVGKPIVLDLSAVDLSPLAITHLIKSIESRNIRVLGLEGVEQGRLSLGMPPLLSGGRHCAVQEIEPEKPQLQQPTSLLLDQPVRSGQSIVFPDGDVTVLGAVSSGAEIVAGGSIHVYGALRGRAMAGINGNAAARIYCQKIEAELVAIDGYYQTAEQIDAALRGRAVQARLEGHSMKIVALN